MRTAAAAVFLFAAVLSTTAGAQSLDELYKAALKEGGRLNFYATLAQINAERILPVFEKRFPGIKVNHVDATADKLATRAITESRGGKMLADVFQFSLENILQLEEQKLLLDKLPPEAAEYPANLKGATWIASDLIFIISAWNTNHVKAGEEPKTFEDYADPKWKGKIIAEPRDLEILMGLTQKFKSQEKAIAVLRRVAANNPEFHSGHSQLAELLVAGQAATCFSCYSHHFPSRIRKGAPLGYSLTEGVATIVGAAIARGGPHPNTAMLWTRWASSTEGQQAFAQGGRTPAHPKVEPRDKTRPATIYAVGPDEIRNWSKYEKEWKAVFKLR